MKWTWPSIWDGEKGGWWRVIATLVLTGIGVAAGVALVGVEAATKSSPTGSGLIGLLKLTITAWTGTVGFLLGVRFVHGKPISCVLTDGRPFRFALGLQSALIWALLWFGGEWLIPENWEHLSRRAGQMPLTNWLILSGGVLFILLVPAALEEMLYRGYLQTRVGAWVKRPWLAVTISAIVFAFLHGGLGSVGQFDILVGALALGAASVRAGTLSPAIVMHTIENTLDSTWHKTSQTTTWIDLVLLVVKASVWLAWLWWATRKKDV